MQVLRLSWPDLLSYSKHEPAKILVKNYIPVKCDLSDTYHEYKWCGFQNYFVYKMHNQN